MIIEYEGTQYHGFQLQANAPTIQSELENSVWRLSGERVRVMAASRTDAGVHAEGQVVEFRTKSQFPPSVWLRGLNHYLPLDIAVKAAYRVDENFNVRRDALSREYRYYIINSGERSALRRRMAHFAPKPLDANAMNLACQLLIGEHNLTPFTPSLDDEEDSGIRTIYVAETQRKGDMVIFDIIANSFLPHQVRSTVGGLIRVGMGKMNVETFWERARSKVVGAIGPLAPPCGLFLMKVNYSGFPKEQN
jgi:tRNA pseudouridine38-40 synthase